MEGALVLENQPVRPYPAVIQTSDGTHITYTHNRTNTSMWS